MIWVVILWPASMCTVISFYNISLSTLIIDNECYIFHVWKLLLILMYNIQFTSKTSFVCHLSCLLNGGPHRELLSSLSTCNNVFNSYKFQMHNCKNLNEFTLKVSKLYLVQVWRWHTHFIFGSIKRRDHFWWIMITNLFI